MKEGFQVLGDHTARPRAEAAFNRWKGKIPAELQTDFKDNTSAMINWHEEVFSYFEQHIANAYTESVNRLAKDMNCMGRGYSLEVIRARMLYDGKARKDGSATVQVAAPSSDTEVGFVTAATVKAKPRTAERVFEYGPCIPTLWKLLEEGRFDD